LDNEVFNPSKCPQTRRNSKRDLAADWPTLTNEDDNYDDITMSITYFNIWTHRILTILRI